MCRVVERLVKLGEQVLDLTALAGQRLLPGLTLPGDTPPSQAAFDSALLHALRNFDPRRPVWTRDGTNGLGGIALPPSLHDALQFAESLWLEVPTTVRAQAWTDRMVAMGVDLAGLLHAISASTGSPSNAVIDRWRSLAENGHAIDALTEVITGYLDPLGPADKSTRQSNLIRLDSLTVDAVASEVERWRNAATRTATDGNR